MGVLDRTLSQRWFGYAVDYSDDRRHMAQSRTVS